MIAFILRLIKTIVLLPYTLWRELEQTVQHQLLVQKHDQVNTLLLETREQIKRTQVKLATCADDPATSALERERLGHLLLKELQLNRYRLGLRKQLLGLWEVA